MKIKPERQQYSQFKNTVKRLPVWGEEFVPHLNPALLYRLLFADSANSFLFESGKGPDATARYSFMGESASTLIRIPSSDNHNSNDPLCELEQINFSDQNPNADYPPHFWGGWVGYIGYEAAWYFERLPRKKTEKWYGGHS